MLALHAGVKRKSAWLLALAGLLAGLTLQTHPLSIAALFGMLGWFLFRHGLRGWLRNPAPYLALACFAAGYAPMIVANLGPNSPLLHDAQDRGYAFGPTLVPEDYAGRFADLAKLVLTALERPSPFLPFSVQVLGLMIMGGMIVAWRRGNGMLVSVALSTLVLLSIVVRNFSWAVAARYVNYLVPLLSIALASLLMSIFDAAGNADLHAAYSPLERLRSSTTSLLRRGGMLGIVLVIVFLTVDPLNTLRIAYSQSYESGRTNVEYFRLLDLLRHENACGPRLLVEETPFTERWFNQYLTINSIHYLLTLEHCRHRWIKLKDMEQIVESQNADWYILAAQDAGRLSCPLDPVTTIAAFPNIQPAPVVLYGNEHQGVSK
jgi:hypothetical protein